MYEIPSCSCPPDPRPGEKFVIANYSDVPDADMEVYAAHDVELQRRICDAIVPQLEANPDLVGIYELERAGELQPGYRHWQ